MSDVTRAEVCTRSEICVAACAEAWRGDGEIIASPMGLIPALGARLAKLTFAPGLMLSDGDANYLTDPTGAESHVEAHIPYRQLFDFVWHGSRHVMMGASQLDRFGNQNISAIGPEFARPKAQLIGVRGAPGNTINHPTSYWIANHSPKVFVEKVDVVSGLGYDRARGAGHAARFHELRRVVTNLAVFDFQTKDYRMRVRSVHPGVSIDDVVDATGFVWIGTDRGRVEATPGPDAEALRLIREVLDPENTREREVPSAGKAMRTHAGAADPHAVDELVGVRHPIVQTGMGWVAGPHLVTATARAGGLGILASATMSDDELAAAIREVKERTDAPFGVNLRADAADAAERVDLLIKEGVRVASFALAPKQELIAKLKDAGTVVVPSIGAKRHAEKVAAWGVDAVVVQGGEGGGHTGGVATSLLLPQITAAVDIPVLAAGGFFDGRGLAAALAYGAEGIAMGTRFLLTSDSRDPDAVKTLYLAADVNGTVATPKIDGVPHRVLRTGLVEQIERSGTVSSLLRSARNGLAFKKMTGMSLRAMVKDGLAMRRHHGLRLGQVVMAANTPMLLKAGLVRGDPAAGVLSAGQVVGLIEDLPSCEELIGRIVEEAVGGIGQDFGGGSGLTWPL